MWVRTFSASASWRRLGMSVAFVTFGVVAGVASCVDEEPDKPPAPPGGKKQEVCGEFALETGAKVLFVLDKSGTMFDPGHDWDHDADPDTPDVLRWTSLYRVVELVVDGFDDQLSLGALLFPSKSSACNVNVQPEIPVAANNGQVLLDALPGPMDFFDAYHLTPLAEGLQNGIDYLLGFDPHDSKAIILVSDGVPSKECEGGLADATDAAREAWEQHGIPTFVVGIAIEDTYAQEYALLAEAGGRPDPVTGFYDTQDEVQLEAAMSEIAAAIPDCMIKLDEEPTYPELVGIALAGDTLSPLDVCDGDGWVWADEDYRLIELCGSACEALMAGETDVIATYGCPESSETDG